ncbi:nitronate monooxygenase [Herbiconiux sp. KACC 21604]|uniref:nitronate monooxygenase n=1 Tax=unclassified Herbiconiux TaxID=2618217 RepID=UPI0014929EDB|nr:nitronate monooxygenase [Herbiconiux sp. SALV-R1]QJU55529.1 nitronate monooxygenase [Herbiconiux sp. SALV-R1]WPO86714.1 nitronate monooxygenase [Herbiconiux sp. KACC 21604]
MTTDGSGARSEGRLLDLRRLARPIVQAPMAGGPSTPALAAAVGEAGGLGFLAAGYLSPERFEADIVATRELTRAPFGVNLFVPAPSVATRAALDAYRAELAPEAARYGVEVGQARPDDDGWEAKLEIVERLRPAFVSFTFGSPTGAVVERMHAAAVAVAVTVTSAEEAREALAAGTDALVVQGPDAGGHRGTFDPSATPPGEPLPELLAEVARVVQEREVAAVAVVAAGGISTREQVTALLAAGADAVQLGTMFLLADESGTRAAHAAALHDPRFSRTAVTAAFSGRYARGLVNRFIRDHDGTAPLGYPEVNQLTSPLRAAAAAAGDADGISLWAGMGFGAAFAAPAAAIVERLSSVD